MAQKFSRNYKLYVDTLNSSLLGPNQVSGTDTRSVLIQPPFTVEFDITRDNLASVNRANLTVYNLAPPTRTLIHKDVWETNVYRPVEFWAGYGDGLPSLALEAIQTPLLAQIASEQSRIFPRIFRGNVKRAYSYRSGVNFLTKLECFDGGYASVTGKFSRTYKAGTPIRNIIEDLINAMPNITVGAIGAFPGKLDRGNTFEGDPKSILLERTGGYFFIDNERGYCLNNNEHIQSSVPTLSEENGIIGVPIKETTLVKVELMFEPGIIIGQSLELKTTTVPYYNGHYKVTGVSHRGMISESVCGEVVTSLILTALDPNSQLVTQR